MKTIKLLMFLMLATTSVMAQKLTKLSKSVNVSSDVTINLNTSHTNIEVDTWNKDVIEIEAYIDGEKVSKEDLQKALDSWNVSVSGSGKEVTIESKGSLNSWSNDFDLSGLDALKDLQFSLADLPEMPELPEMPQLPAMPKMPEMPAMPELPELPEGIGAVNFDYEAYKKDGEAYLEKWSKEYETKYGKDYKEKMKAWGRKFGKTDFEAYSKQMEKWGEEYGKQFEGKFGKEFEAKMEAWGKDFGEKWEKEYGPKMEAWGEKFGKEMEERAKAMEERGEAMKERGKALEERQKSLADRQKALAEREESLAKSLENKINTKVKKTIKIKMPKKAKLQMNVRHGELKFASVITNMKGAISHGTLTANDIDGSQTSINVSYSPVLIANWNSGELKLNYVENAMIHKVNRMLLGATSSNVTINNLAGNAVIDGSFGALQIGNILESFNNLNIILENSEALLTLPKTNYNFQYKGSRSKLKHPKNKNTAATTFSTGDMASGKTIVVNAKFSEVTMQ
jgi:hypothetical protein